MALGSSPLQWFEITLTITLNLSVYAEVGALGLVVFELRKDFNIVILGPVKYKPTPFDPVAKLDSNTGRLELEKDVATCESKEGAAGLETIQCWETASKTPVIKTFKDVKSLYSRKSSITFKCIKSDLNVSSHSAHVLPSLPTLSLISFFVDKLSNCQVNSSTGVVLDFTRCRIETDEIFVGQSKANIGKGVVSYSGGGKKVIKLPSPIQDSLETTIQDCNNMEWKLDGHTNLVIKGRNIGQNCQVKVNVDNVNGTSQSDANLLVDFELDQSCEKRYSVELKKDRILIDDSYIEFGKSFKNIQLLMSPCDDIVKVTSTLENTESVSIISGGGNGKPNTDLSDEIAIIL